MGSDRATTLLAIYTDVTGEPVFDHDSERDDILAEMERIAAAPSEEAAFAVIEWWNRYEPDTMRETARALWLRAREVPDGK